MPRLAFHAITYLLLLVGATWMVGADSSFSGDAGAYGGQVYALRQGAWALDRPLPVVAAEHEGWLNSAITPAGPTPYTANPAYAQLLHGVVAVIHGGADPGESAGDLAPGLHLVPVLAAVVAAATAWRLAHRYHPPSAPLAFWVLALGPTLVNATTLWAHTLSTALGGIAVLAMLAVTDPDGAGLPSRAQTRPDAARLAGHAATDPEAADRPSVAVAGPVEAPDGSWPVDSAVGGPAAVGLASPAGAVVEATPAAEVGARSPVGPPAPRLVAAVALILALSAGAAVRTEALFWVGAVCVTGLIRARTTPGRAAMAGAGAISIGVWVLNRGWGQALRADRLPIETSIEALNDTPGWLAGRLPAAWMLLVNSPTGGIGPLLTLVALILCTVAVYRIARSGSTAGNPGLLLTVAVAAYGARLVVDPATTISGVLAAWPAMAVAACSAAAPSIRRAVLPLADRWHPWPLAGPVLGLGLCVLATQYASSGGLQWGGRYLSFAFVPMAVLAAVGGRPLFDRHRRAMRGLLLVPALIGLSASFSLHRNHDRAIEQASVGNPDVVVTASAALPRIAWRDLPVAYYRATEDDVGVLLDDLARSGVPVVNVHGLTGADLGDAGGYRVFELDGPVRRLELTGPTTAVVEGSDLDEQPAD
ncbi:MAG: hypothetical protein AAFN30_15530 [Actinomycetota bacterium]